MMAFQALTGEVWAIERGWLEALSAMAQREFEIGGMLAQVQKERAPNPYVEALGHMIVAGTATRLDGGTGKALRVGNVAVLQMNGPIFPRANMMTEHSGAVSCTGYMADMAAAERTEGIEAMLHLVDSPGGAVTGVGDLCTHMHAFNARMPQFTHYTGMGASAAYWLGSASARATADRTALIGSVGVAVAIPKQKNPDARGMITVDVVSSNAPNKRIDIEDDEAKAALVARLDGIEKHFHADVARNRGVSIEHVATKFGRGGLENADTAVSSQMIDGILTLEGAINRASRIGKQNSRSRPSGRT